MKTIHCDSRAEAEIELERTKQTITPDEDGKRFCPQINAYCNTDCVCYVPPRIREFSPTHFSVNGSYCDHVLVTGVIWINS